MNRAGGRKPTKPSRVFNDMTQDKAVRPETDTNALAAEARELSEFVREDAARDTPQRRRAHMAGMLALATKAREASTERT